VAEGVVLGAAPAARWARAPVDARAAAAAFQARLKPGTRVQARFADGSGAVQWYDAVVAVGSATNGTDVRVKWMGYGTVDAVAAAAVRPPPLLPSGWLESTDEASGFPYYTAATGETTWTRPAPPRRPPPPKRAVAPRARAAVASPAGRLGAVLPAASSPVAIVGGFASKANRRAIRNSRRALTANMTRGQIAAMVDAAQSYGFAGGCDCGVAGC